MNQFKIYLYSSQGFNQMGGGGKSSMITYDSLKNKTNISKFQTLNELQVAIKKEKPDLVIFQNLINLIPVYKICKKYNVPFLPTINSHFTCAKGTHITGGGFGHSCLKCSLLGMAKCALDGHYKMQFSYLTRLKLLVSVPYRYYRVQYRIKVLNNCAGVIVIGKTLKSILIQNGVTNKIYVCPQPIQLGDLVKKKLKSKTKSNNKRKKILFMSGLDTTKGSLVLFEAFRRLNRDDTDLIIGGQIYSILKKKDFLPWPKNVKLLGEVPYDKVQELYSSVDLVIFPSLLFEPYGRVWAEALTYGKPVIGFNGRGGPSDYLTNNENGCLVDLDIDLLVKSIGKLLDDENFAKKIGEAGRKFAEQYLVADKVSIKLLDIYQEVLANDK